MNLVDRFGSDWKEWLGRQHAKLKMVELSREIAEVTRQAQTGEGDGPVMARQHIQSAERAHDKALVFFKEEEWEECERHSDRGLLHLRLASIHLTAGAPVKIDPALEEAQIEGTLVLLANSIARFKIAVEYTNCVVSEEVQERLVYVVQIFANAITALKDEEPILARSLAEAGLLILYALGQQIELDNRQAIVAVQPFLKGLSKDGRKIKEVADTIGDARKQFAQSQEPLLETIDRHVRAAIENYDAAIEALMDEDAADIHKLLTVAGIEIRMASRLFNSHEGTTDSATVEAAVVHDEAERREFASRTKIIQRIALRESKHAEDLRTRLDAVVAYYNKALAALRKQDLKNASEFARAAHLDLDFARQMLLSDKPPTYADF